MTADASSRKLRAAWDQMMADIERARGVIDDPGFHAPPASDRNLAEGYRYLLGFVFGAIERSLGDPDFPYFRRAIQPTDKATIDNADASYLCAEIDGTASYVVRGRALDFRHWRGAAPVEGSRAPQYVIFEATSAYAGDSGSLGELTTKVRANTGTLDSSRLAVDADGRFEILLAPVRPEGHGGNFIATRALRSVRETSEQVEHVARYLVLRELFCDWEDEFGLDLEIFRVDRQGGQPQPYDSERAARQMTRVGEIVAGQMRFWNEFYAVVLETYADMNGDGARFMPRNDLNAASPAGIATGGGQTTNYYSGGVFELGPGESLIVEIRMPLVPQYWGFHLSNLWGESLDYANHVSSLNVAQAALEPDGSAVFVVAHDDPGIWNWLDTTGHAEGFMTIRWTYAKGRTPTVEQIPQVRVEKVDAAQVRSRLAGRVRDATAAERREQIRIRQQHVQRRYRQY